jgi:hypothetical protein
MTVRGTGAAKITVPAGIYEADVGEERPAE